MNVKFYGSVVVLAFICVLTTQAYAKEVVVTQKNKTFMLNGKKLEAYELRKGDTIHFENQDPWFHNVFSLSDLKTFDLGSYKKGDSRPVHFNKAGVVEIECAIHPAMFMEVKIKP
jgi:plastocyanin